MREMFKVFFLFTIILFTVNCSAQSKGWEDLEKIFGRPGAVQDDVIKFSFPRTDLNVKVGDFPVDAGLALTSWVAFVKHDQSAVMMGDLVLTDQEVKSVISKLISENIEITALHNHILGESPGIKYLHFSAEGELLKLAQSIKSVISITGTPMSTIQGQNAKDSINWSSVESVLGNGKHNGKLLRYNFPRSERLTENDMELPSFMGAASAVNFQMEGSRTALTGDLVLLANEVNPVIKKLDEYGISITAIHNHMLNDNPRLFMLHFWAVDNPEKLARGIKAALNMTNSRK